MPGSNWIKKAIKRPGALTKKAKAKGMSAMEYAGKVSKSPKKYSARTQKQANLAKTLAKMSKMR